MSTTLPVWSTTATLTPVRMPGSSPMVTRGPAGAASSRSFRLRGEHADRLGLGALLAGAPAGRLRACGASLCLPGQAHGLAAAMRRPGGRDRRCRRRRGCVASAGCGLPASCAHVEIEVEHALVAAAQHGERAVRGHVLDALAEVEIVGELGAFRALALHAPCEASVALAPQPFAQAADQRRRPRPCARSGCGGRRRAPPSRRRRPCRRR